MQQCGDFKIDIEKFINSFKETSGRIRIISRKNVDAICGSAILINAFGDLTYTCSFYEDLDLGKIKELRNLPEEIFVFVDIGSREIKEIVEILHDRKIFVFSRAEVHFPAKVNVINPYLFCSNVVNPRALISVAGMCYHFAKKLDSKNVKSAYLGVLGSMGDNVKRCEEVSEIEDEIVQDAILNKSIEIKKGVKIGFPQNCPVYKALAYSINPFIPGVSGSEKNAADFVRDIDLKFDTKKKIVELNIEDVKNILTKVGISRLGSGKDSTAVEDIYVLEIDGHNEEFSDAKETIRLLEACLILNKPSLGVAYCVSPRQNFKKAETLMKHYRKLMFDSLYWFNDNRKNKDHVETGEKHVLIHARENIPEEALLPFLNNIAEMGIYKEGSMIVLHGRGKDGNSLIWLRIVGDDIGGNNFGEQILGKENRFLVNKILEKRQNTLISANIEHEEEILKKIVESLESKELEETIE